jgi:hypothetical protein
MTEQQEAKTNIYKICTRCKTEKHIDEYYNSKKSKDKHSGKCKECSKKEIEKYRKECADKIEVTRKKYYAKNRDKIIKYSQDFAAKNREYIREKDREYYYKNHEETLQKNRDFYNKNKDKINARRRASLAERKKRDELFVLTISIRKNLNTAFKRRKLNKNSKTKEILCCDMEFFMQYIEAQFTEGMNWGNYGKWHLDHIIPLSSADTYEDVVKLCHYTNYQPLWAKDNMMKFDKIPNNVQLKFM